MSTVEKNIDQLFARRKEFTKVQSVRYKHVIVNAFGTPIRVCKDRPAAELYCTQNGLSWKQILLIECDE